MITEGKMRKRSGISQSRVAILQSAFYSITIPILPLKVVTFIFSFVTENFFVKLWKHYFKKLDR